MRLFLGAAALRFLICPVRATASLLSTCAGAYLLAGLDLKGLALLVLGMMLAVSIDEIVTLQDYKTVISPPSSASAETKPSAATGELPSVEPNRH